MTIQSLIRSSLFAAAVVLIVGASASPAQEVSVRDDSRDESQLRVDVKEAIDRDTDVANTALVFNNTESTAMTVICRAYGPAGNAIGRKVASVPARGLRYLRASDLSNGADFIGSAVCSTRGRVAASAVFLAPGSITSLDVIQAGPWDSTTIRFPLVATY